MQHVRAECKRLKQNLQDKKKRNSDKRKTIKFAIWNSFLEQSKRKKNCKKKNKKS